MESVFEIHDLLGPKAARVRELEHRPVAGLERRLDRDAVEELGDVVAPQSPRQTLLALRGRQKLGGIRVGMARIDQVAVEGPHRRELAADARLLEASAREPRREAAQVAVAELTGLGAARGRPLGQFAQVRRVRALGRSGRSAAVLFTRELEEGGLPAGA